MRLSTHQAICIFNEESSLRALLRAHVYFLDGRVQVLAIGIRAEMTITTDGRCNAEENQLSQSPTKGNPAACKSLSW